MIIFSFETKPGTDRGPVVLVMVIEKENLGRMKQSDPFDLKLAVHGANDRNLDLSRRLRDLDIVIAYEEDLNQIMSFHKKRDLAGLMSWLERGRKILPGDVTRGVPLRRN